MTVNLDDLKDRIETLKHAEWSVKTDTLDGPEIRDAYNNLILVVDVGYAVWECTDEEDGCPEKAREAVALAKLLVDLPGYALELIEAYKRLKRENEDLERDLEEAEREWA